MNKGAIDSTKSVKYLNDNIPQKSDKIIYKRMEEKILTRITKWEENHLEIQTDISETQNDDKVMNFNGI